MDWVLLGGIIIRDNSPFPDYRTYLVPKSDFKIIDDWHVMGLKGTGSKSVELKEAFVPDYRQLPMIASQMFTTAGLKEGTAAAPLFRVPFPTIFGACITTPALGAAQGMLDLYVEATKSATSLYSGAKWSVEQVTQLRIAESDADLRAGRLQLAANFDEIMDTIANGGDLSLLERGRYRFDHCNLVDIADRAADRLFVASGARSLNTAQPFQRLYCDIQAARVVKLGLVPEAGSSLLLPRLLGHQRAAELLLLGEAIDARTAHEIGLVNRVVEDDALLSTALAAAKAVAALPPEAVRYTKALLKLNAPDLPDRMKKELELFGAQMRSPAFHEIATAFMEKRKPNPSVWRRA